MALTHSIERNIMSRANDRSFGQITLTGCFVLFAM